MVAVKNLFTKPGHPHYTETVALKLNYSLIVAKEGQTSFGRCNTGPCRGDDCLRLAGIRPLCKELFHPITLIGHTLNASDSILLREPVPPKGKRPQELARFSQSQLAIFKR